MGKQLIIFVMGSLAVFIILSRNIAERNNNITTSAVNHYSEIMASNTANSLCEMLISKLGDTQSFRSSSWTNISMFDGVSQYRIIDTLVGSDSLIKIHVRGTYFNTTKKVETLVKANTAGSPGFFPTATVKAAITTNNSVKTLGNLTVDGRDHDINGNLVGANGTYAIWTTGTYNRSGNSHIGSTVSGTDYAPAKVENNDVRLESQVYGGGYPNNPDDILGGAANGFPGGTLKSFAQSGSGGSQYVTNPSDLTYPLSGVTYVELASGDVWNPSNINGTGILIVHNSAVNAQIKNLNSGTFKGIMIADDIVHIHTTIIGAVIALSPSPSDGNCIGNGSGDVLFSRAAINGSTANLKSTTTVGYGFGRKRLKVVSWYE